MSLAAAKNARAAPRRRDEARALFRNAILDAAEEVFAEQGFHAARIHDVADRARMAVGTIYNHFGQKEDVLRALLDERSGAILAALAAREGDPLEFEPRLAARMERVLRYVVEHRGFFTLAIEHGLLGGATAAARQIFGKKRLAHVERARAAMRRIVEEGMLEGAVAPLDADLLARFLGSVLRTFTLQILEGKEVSCAEASAVIARLFLRGAAPARRKSR